MSGTKIGGMRAAKTILSRHGEDFYKRIGSMGGKASTKGGFYANRELAREVAAIAGKIGKKGLKFIVKKGDYYYYEDKITGEKVVCKYDRETNKIVRTKNSGRNEE